MVPGKYKGDKAFQAILEEIECHIDVYNIKAYLSGFLLAPDLPPPSYILDEILLVDIKEEPAFEDEKQAERFYEQFFALWNELADLDNLMMTTQIRPLANGVKRRPQALLEIDSLAADIIYFLQALEEGGLEIDDPPVQPLTDLIDTMNAMACLLGNVFETLENRKIKVSEAVEELQKVYEFWKKAFPLAGKILMEARQSNWAFLEEKPTS